MAMPPNILATVACVALGALNACSTVPDAAWPAQASGELEVIYRFADGAPRIFRMPASDDELTVLWLRADPAVVDERFVDGQRIWVAPDHLDELRVHFGYRLFDSGAGRDPTGVEERLARRFPGGEVLEHGRVGDQGIAR